MNEEPNTTTTDTRRVSRRKSSRQTKDAQPGSLHPVGSADFVRIWSTEDDGSEIHLVASGNDYTICGHDIEGDDMVHKKPPQELPGRHRVTCSHCLQLIADVKRYLNPPNGESSGASDASAETIG